MNLRCVRGSIAVTGVSLSQATATLSIGGTVTLTATVQPVNATNQAVAWSSNNPAVATVTNGVVTAVAAGTATITVTTADGGKTATCDVTVAPATIPVTGVTLSQTAANLNVGGTVTLIATVQPTNATNQAVAWSSNNSAVATVTDGVVTAIAAGTATITVTTADGSKAATCTITVSVPVTGVTLSQTTATVNVGSKLTLTATVQPSTATNKTVSWKSSKTTVATVANGVVTAVAAGTATITVTTADGSKTATCAITVRVPVTGVTLSPTTATVNVGSKLTLTATVQPTTATNKTVAWKSSKTTVATVANGVVTAVAAGTATITVTTADGSKTATCAITVKVPDPTSTLTLNGVVWAPVNVGATVGSWASRPDSHGAMFQFNRSKAWSPTSPAAGVAISGWTASIDEDRSWNESTNAVCPTGWRLPTEAELQDLYSSSRAADVINSGTWADKGTKGAAVAGKFYGPRHASCSLPSNMSNCIFLPASGNRAGADGALVSQGTHGTYSSSTQNNTRNRVVMNFTATSSSIMRTYLKTHAYSVRCVKK
jgi:uncharacterized protein (TIGR02145 family)